MRFLAIAALGSAVSALGLGGGGGGGGGGIGSGVLAVGRLGGPPPQPNLHRTLIILINIVVEKRGREVDVFSTAVVVEIIAVISILIRDGHSS
jgi:hypothetical protein